MESRREPFLNSSEQYKPKVEEDEVFLPKDVSQKPHFFLLYHPNFAAGSPWFG